MVIVCSFIFCLVPWNIYLIICSYPFSYTLFFCHTLFRFLLYYFSGVRIFPHLLYALFLKFSVCLFVYMYHSVFEYTSPFFLRISVVCFCPLVCSHASYSMFVYTIFFSSVFSSCSRIIVYSFTLPGVGGGRHPSVRLTCCCTWRVDAARGGVAGEGWL